MVRLRTVRFPGTRLNTRKGHGASMVTPGAARTARSNRENEKLVVNRMVAGETPAPTGGAVGAAVGVEVGMPLGAGDAGDPPPHVPTLAHTGWNLRAAETARPRHEEARGSAWSRKIAVAKRGCEARARGFTRRGFAWSRKIAGGEGVRVLDVVSGADARAGGAGGERGVAAHGAHLGGRKADRVAGWVCVGAPEGHAVDAARGDGRRRRVDVVRRDRVDHADGVGVGGAVRVNRPAANDCRRQPNDYQARHGGRSLYPRARARAYPHAVPEFTFSHRRSTRCRRRRRLRPSG